MCRVMYLVAALLMLIGLAVSQDVAQQCNPELCQLPSCFCGGPTIPGNLTREEIPQLVMLTFDDAVNEINKAFYSKLFKKHRTNPDKCPIKATFYVSHEYTDYGQVNDLYRAGHEIASHTITHSHGANFDEDRWANEVVGQAEMLVRYAGVSSRDIKGMRAPFLAIGGDTMFGMLPKHGFTYESSMPIYKEKEPSWPYTLDYAMPHTCTIHPCPKQSHPGLWEIPMTSWTDETGVRCSMADSCSYPQDAAGVQRVFTRNFLNFYTKSKAPFPIFIHAAWFINNEQRQKGFFDFIDSILELPDVYFVTSQEVLDFTQNPENLASVHTSGKFGCDHVKARSQRGCSRRKCYPYHNGGKRQFTTCQRRCPQGYPWLFNFEGKVNGGNEVNKLASSLLVDL